MSSLHYSALSTSLNQQLIIHGHFDVAVDVISHMPNQTEMQKKELNDAILDLLQHAVNYKQTDEVLTMLKDRSITHTDESSLDLFIRYLINIKKFGPATLVNNALVQDPARRSEFTKLIHKVQRVSHLHQTTYTQHPRADEALEGAFHQSVFANQLKFLDEAKNTIEIAKKSLNRAKPEEKEKIQQLKERIETAEKMLQEIEQEGKNLQDKGDSIFVLQ